MYVNTNTITVSRNITPVHTPMYILKDFMFSFCIESPSVFIGDLSVSLVRRSDGVYSIFVVAFMLLSFRQTLIDKIVVIPHRT